MTRVSSRILLGLALIGLLLAAFAVVHLTRPAWYERFWHPLRYKEIVLGHARNYDLDPALLAIAHGWEVRPGSNGAELRQAAVGQRRSASLA